MRTKPPLVLNFGIELESTEPQFSFYDNTTSTYSTITLPSGLYFYNHPTTAKNIVAVLNVLLLGSCVISRQNDRQLKFTFADTADHILLRQTENDDYLKLAEMLGLYDNSGNLDYYTQVSMGNNKITQVTLCTWFSSAGRLADSRTERGYPRGDAIYTESQSGKSAGVATGRRRKIKDLKFTAVSANDIDSADGIETSTQTTLGTTEVASFTTSFWRAYNPELHASCFYAELETWNEATIKGEWWITVPLDDNCKSSIPGNALIFELTITACFVPVEEQDKYLYFADGNYIQTQNAAFDLIGDMSIILDVYPTAFNTDAYWLLIGFNTGNIQQGLRYSSGNIQWVQGATAVGFDIINLHAVTTNTLYRLVLTRTGAIGTNNLVSNLNGNNVTITTTKAVPTSVPYLMLMDGTHITLPSNSGYIKSLQLFNRVLTAAEKSNAVLGIDPSPETSILTCKFNEQGGNNHLDASGNNRVLTSVNATWQVMP